MSEELKLVNCGCGGEAKVDIKLIPSAPIERKRIYCSKCYISTDWMKSEDEAIEVWNRAMGVDKVDELMEHIWRDKLDTREKIANLVGRMLR